MSGGDDDRTEQPTPRRLDEARKKGQVALSRDLTAAVTLLVGAGGLTLLGPKLVAGLSTGLSRSLSSLHEMEAGTLTASMMTTGGGLLASAAPLILLALVAAVAGSVAQVGFLFTGATLGLRPERMDPIEGLRRAFSLQTAVGIAGGLAKGAVILGVLAASLWQDRITLASLSNRPLPEALAVLPGAAFSLFGKTALALLALGVVDWAYRRWQLRRDLRMSRREIADELREFEGDPAARERRRTHRTRLDEARRLDGVAAAGVVITDDADLAVAIRRDGEDVSVVAMDRGAGGDRIRRRATEHGVATLERSDLARALYRRGAAGRAVPAGLRDESVEALEIAREMNSR
jgi:flagellar biosynthetic protein FlhB